MVESAELKNPSPEALARARMNSNHVASSKFKCPHCGFLCQQDWGVPTKVVTHMANRAEPQYRSLSNGGFLFAACVGCCKESVFFGGELIFPSVCTAPEPNPDMPLEIKKIYQEARLIANASPRSAAALLRLAIEKLCPILGAKAAKINEMIKELVRTGKIPTEVQQALDVVRVLGNEAVHPGTIQIDDENNVAPVLFQMVNIIVERAISQPKAINEAYALIPPAKLKGIEDRDKP